MTQVKLRGHHRHKVSTGGKATDLDGVRGDAPPSCTVADKPDRALGVLQWRRMTVRREPVREHKGVIPETFDPYGDRITLMFNPRAAPTTRQEDHCPARTVCPGRSGGKWGELDRICTVGGTFGIIASPSPQI